MQLQSHLMRVGDQIQWKKAKQIICEQHTIDLAISKRGKLIGFALVCPIHVNYEKERRQNAPLPESNAHKNGFDCLPLTRTIIDTSVLYARTQISGWR